MAWFKVDDGFAWHTKAVRAGNAACGLWVRAGSWSSQQLTEGYVPSEIASALGSKAEVTKLVASGLWVPSGDGFQFHQFLDRNPTREQVEAERAASKERQQRAREKARAVRQEEDGSNVTHLSRR